MKILIASDHAGLEYKQKLILSELAKSLKIEFLDFGPKEQGPVDYPDYAKLVAAQVDADTSLLGILICGSGQGMNITANKFAKVRAALCLNESMAELARAHNDANILCLGSRLVSFEETLKIVKAFLKTPFEGGRHQTRVDKMNSVV